MNTTGLSFLERDGGRRVAVHRLADGGRTVVFCHAAPGAANFDPDPEHTRLRNITLLAPDRPGYGQSDPVAADEWPTVSSAAADVAAVVEQLGGAPVSVAGWSAGGRVALALAALYPELVDRVVVMCTPAPNEAVPWIPPEQQAGLEAMRDFMPGEARAELQRQLAPLVPADANVPGALELLGAGPADEIALAMAGARERLAAMVEAAFAQGAVGLADDIVGYGMRPWGFEFLDVKAKTLLLYGSADPIAGQRHGAWYQRQLPSARLEVVPGAGHLLVLPMWRRALAHLAPSRSTNKRE